MASRSDVDEKERKEPAEGSKPAKRDESARDEKKAPQPAKGKPPKDQNGKPSGQSQPDKPEAKKKYRLYCPYCRQRTKAYVRHLGQKVRCPRCQKPFLVQVVADDEGENQPVAVALPPEQRKETDKQAEQEPEAPEFVERASLLPGRLLGAIGGVILLGIALFFIIRLGTSRSFVAEDGALGWYRQPEALPPPVKDAVMLGREVWRLDQYRMLGTAYGRCLYLVMYNGELEQVVGVLSIPANEAKRLVGPRLAPRWGEVQLWFAAGPGQQRRFFPELQKETVSQWTLRQEKDRWVLQREETITTKRQITSYQETTTIVIDPEVGEGYWETKRRIRVKYRGAQAYLGTRSEEKEQRGGVFPVRLP